MDGSERKGLAEHALQTLCARRFGVEGCAADVFFHDAGLLLIGVVQKAVFYFYFKEIGIIRGGMLSGGFERVIACFRAVLPLLDMGGFMGEEHGRIQAHALWVAVHIVF